jgi:hypothetical protein
VTDRPLSLPYRKYTRGRLGQGDIALCEVIQLRSASGSEGRGPGSDEVASLDLPYAGEYQDFELPVAGVGGKAETRIVRVWTVFSMVLTQNCEIEWADPNDSRVTIAPILTRAQWPEGPWGYLPRTPPPGYLYLPPLDRDDAAIVGLEDPWPESVVVLASACTTTRRIVKPRRLLALALSEIPRLQDSIARFYGVRGFAALPALRSTLGKHVHDVVETGQTISGPSSLIKVYFGEGDDASADDEITIAYWGVRPTSL